MITELRQPLHMQTPQGPGWALFVIDYGTEHDLLWVIFLDGDGACWTIPNPEIRLSPNWTAGRRAATPSSPGSAERPVPPAQASTRKPKHWL